MKNIKRLIAVLAVMVTTAAVAEENAVIFWQVRDPTLPSGESVFFDYATIQVKNSGSDDYKDLYIWEDFLTGLTDETQVEAIRGIQTKPTQSGYFDAAVAESFLVQLYASSTNPSSDTLVGWQSYTIAEVSDSWNFVGGSFNSRLLVTNVIPEPTSGLLLLFGVAGLALKRRRQAV